MTNKLEGTASELVVRLAQHEQELAGILKLQRRNVAENLSPEELRRDGFVTARHDLEILRAMHAEHPSVVALAGGEVVGYILMMPLSFRSRLPILVPMFEVFDSLSYRGRPFSQYRYFVHGQVCVDKAFRGSGLFDRMFEHYRQVYSPHFDFVVTEIAARNERSLRAHERVGFEVVHSYVDPTLDETWRVVVWDFRSPASKAP